MEVQTSHDTNGCRESDYKTTKSSFSSSYTFFVTRVLLDFGIRSQGVDDPLINLVPISIRLYKSVAPVVSTEGAHVYCSLPLTWSHKDAE